MLTVCVSASSTDGALTTTDYLRYVMGATSTTDNAAQVAMVAAASKWAESYVGYPLLAQTYSESIAAYGRNDLLLERAPIRVVLRLFDSTSTDTASEYCSTDYRVDFDAGILNRDGGWAWTAGEAYHLGRYVVPHSELHPWYAEYTAGYIYPELSTGDVLWSTSGIGGTTSTGQTLPKDIETAVALKAQEFYTGGGQNVSSKEIGDFSVTYGSQRASQLGPAESLLEPYVRRLP